jgi:hypothetical protein
MTTATCHCALHGGAWPARWEAFTRWLQGGSMTAKAVARMAARRLSGGGGWAHARERLHTRLPVPNIPVRITAEYFLMGQCFSLNQAALGGVASADTT